MMSSSLRILIHASTPHYELRTCPSTVSITLSLSMKV